jgi:hypothetical protein
LRLDHAGSGISRRDRCDFGSSTTDPPVTATRRCRTCSVGPSGARSTSALGFVFLRLCSAQVGGQQQRLAWSGHWPPSAERRAEPTGLHSPPGRTGTAIRSRLRSSILAAVVGVRLAVEAPWRWLCGRRRSERQATRVSGQRRRALRLRWPVRHSGPDGGWRRLVRIAPWRRESWRCRSDCRSAGWSHRPHTDARCQRCLGQSGSVSSEVSGRLGVTEKDAMAIR